MRANVCEILSVGKPLLYFIHVEKGDFANLFLSCLPSNLLT